jgi:hypothetical protein
VRLSSLARKRAGLVTSSVEPRRCGRHVAVDIDEHGPAEVGDALCRQPTSIEIRLRHVVIDC